MHMMSIISDGACGLHNSVLLDPSRTPAFFCRVILCIRETEDHGRRTMINNGEWGRHCGCQNLFAGVFFFDAWRVQLNNPRVPSDLALSESHTGDHLCISSSPSRGKFDPLFLVSRSI
jgi:hypothetical protein